MSFYYCDYSLRINVPFRILKIKTSLFHHALPYCTFLCVKRVYLCRVICVWCVCMYVCVFLCRWWVSALPVFLRWNAGDFSCPCSVEFEWIDKRLNSRADRVCGSSNGTDGGSYSASDSLCCLPDWCILINWYNAVTIDNRCVAALCGDFDTAVR